VRVVRRPALRLEPYLIALGLITLAACRTAAPPPNAEYPSLVLPVRSEPPATAPRPAGAGAQSPDSSPAGESSAGSSRVPLVRSPHGDLPDPPPLSERAQWSYPVSYDRGTIRVGEPELVCLPRPQSTPRRIGRFAFELWLGHELVERLRFDFPLLASEEPPEGPRRQLREPPRFAPGARVSVTLRVPASERAATARILDRATGETSEVSWPPPSGADAALACRKQGPQSKPSAAPPAPDRPTGAGR
jgi:hypothetical protein